MATPKRRSARLSGRDTPQRLVKSKTADGLALLGALIERDETPEKAAQPSIDNVIATPASNGSLQSRFAQLSKLKTPTTEPKPSHAQMHPQTVHQTTTNAPDSGLKLGFGNPPRSGERKSIAAMQNTPSKIPDTPVDRKSETYEFKFRSASHLSSEAQQLMDNLRDEAARIKEQMRAEKRAQDEKDAEAEDRFQGFGATGRKIAKPKGKAGRFSDVHMAAFKKMDSIANHASAFRASNAPSFAQPTAQSLKRSPSKAGLDDTARPQTVGKGTSGRKPSSRPPNRRTTNVSPFKSLPKLPQGALDSSPAKRQRQSEFDDVSTARPQPRDPEEELKELILPCVVSSSGVPHSLLSPTKSSLARSSSVRAPTATTEKPSMLPRSHSIKSLQLPRPSTSTPFKSCTSEHLPTVQASPSRIPPQSLSRIPRSESAVLNRPLPPLPSGQAQASIETKFLLPRSQSTKLPASPSKTQSIASRLPTFAGLKSILRPSRPQGLQAQPSPERASTPKQPNNANATDSAKKVDFTPSVKSRYAVKLAAESPSPAKIHRDATRPAPVMSDSVGYTTDDETVDEEEWEDAEDDAEVAYPALPTSSLAQKKSPSVQTVDAFVQKAKEVSRREPLDYKSIIANKVGVSPDNPFSTTAFNTTVNKSNPAPDANKVIRSPGSVSKPSPATIRRVRPSDANEMVNPFQDPEKYLPHGIPAKKRRHDSEKPEHFNDGKENGPAALTSKLPGGWKDFMLEEDEGEKRGGKRVRVEKSEEPSPHKKPNQAREAASKAARDRKKSILSMSRLNMLARPKGR